MPSSLYCLPLTPDLFSTCSNKVSQESGSPPFYIGPGIKARRRKARKIMATLTRVPCTLL